MPTPIPEWVGPEARLVLGRLNDLEAIVMSTQDALNAFASRIDAATTDIRADIQRFIDAHPDLDTSPLESAVGRLEGLAAENQPPPA